MQQLCKSEGDNRKKRTHRLAFAASFSTFQQSLVPRSLISPRCLVSFHSFAAPKTLVTSLQCTWQVSYSMHSPQFIA
ncbi:hypothetical protein CBS147346_5652 [Aspergillus niger]|nr:hypothetical protein CBS147346_5652 [Aspergillus niger]